MTARHPTQHRWSPGAVRRDRLIGAILVVLALLITALGLRASEPAEAPSDDEAIRHVLNRVTFGVRRADLDAVREIGLAAYLERQLHPERIPDRALDERLAGLRTLTLTTAEINRTYAQPLFDARRDRKQAGSGTAADGVPKVDPAIARAAALPMQELGEQKVLRAVYSQRQLEAVLTDFWFNHFNVDARKGVSRFLLTEYEREAIRPHVLGRFRDLLGATARSPAMLFYLDNWLSADPNGPHPAAAATSPTGRQLARRQRFIDRRLTDAQRQRLAGVMPQKKGLNENYARELMELHTLGVDGGYTQKDVTEVARVFTGWTLDRPRGGSGAFQFDARLHDPGDKTVLGHTIKGSARNGQDEGERVLDLLARHPSTATFIATKLARRFVSDDPPPALVGRLAARFRDTDGDLQAVMRTLLTSPEFLAPENRKAKTKTPFEFVVSAIRAVNGDIVNARPIVQQVATLGMPLYQCQPPTGYKDTAEAWTNAGALVARMNVAQSVAQGTRPSGLAGPASSASVDGRLIGPVSDTTQAVVAQAMNEWQRVALLLGSPEFQKK